ADFASVAGLGVRGVVDGREVRVGRARWLAETYGVDEPDISPGSPTGRQPAGSTDPAQPGGQPLPGTTPVWGGVDGRIRGAVVVADAIKQTSPQAVQDLRRLGLHPVLLTGDATSTAEAVAGELGIDEVIAQVLPAGKVQAVQALQSGGRVVAMV